ncbi:DUF6809 family protein [Lachnospiraceae bacterium 50-23]
MSIIREIYKEMVQGKPYLDEISKETEKEIAELLKDESQKNREEYEPYRDRLYSVAAIAEEAGFIKGFHFAVGLITECKLESEYTTAKF